MPAYGFAEEQAQRPNGKKSRARGRGRVEKVSTNLRTDANRGTDRFGGGEDDGGFSAEEQQGKKDEGVGNRDVGFDAGNLNAQSWANQHRGQGQHQEPEVD